MKQGGLLCEPCLHEDPKAEPMSSDWFEQLAACAEADVPPALQTGGAQAIQQRLDAFLRWQLDRPMKTLRAMTR